MKPVSGAFALFVVSALGFSPSAYADTLPAGALRFTISTGFAPAPIDVPVPKGSTLVITDVLVTFPGCELLDAADSRLLLLGASGQGTKSVNLQTGIEFYTQLRSRGDCSYVTLTGFWINPS